ncbi:alpha-amylase family glycosyl hydrolase [Asticcacaulis sp. AC402]|uniref:alpha-amylase family glycosyl hydrolase n=1 Tax=Asticcacaulis sp. AC402 TaxID=1282361 RepID=UPI0003C3B5B2|nr:alpha-amylase family glycosyl hydrolase [Asticcacaulis sp. AC402]ESQ76735.1 hypothetical protein ABAC402_03400 [Asticcacaulis sp. AC402]
MKLKTYLGAIALMSTLAAGTAHARIDVSAVAATHKASALPKDWNRTAAFTEIFVRSYKDSNGDGIGDFKGLTSQLDYLKDLGITGIWLMPMNPSQDGDHGYAVNDYRAVDPDYGTMADFEEFLDEAHKRGIGVIIDFVVNHSGSGNAIFLDAAKSKSSPYRDWYLFADSNPGWYDQNMRGVSGAYWSDPWKPVPKVVPGGEGLYYGVFDTTMPDLNLRNPKVIAYLQDSMRFWMNKGVDGFRLDAVTMLLEDGKAAYFNNSGNPTIVKAFKDVVDEYDNRYLICEVSEGRELYLDVCTAFAYGVQQHLIAGIKNGVIAPEVIAFLEDPRRDLMPLALQSHDAYVGDRLTNQFGVNGDASYKVAAAVSILVSATPFGYYGEEIGMSNGGTYNDPGIRSPMSWTGEVLKQRSGSTSTKVAAAGFSTVMPYRDPAINFASQNVASQTGDPSSILEYYRAIYAVRKAHPVLATGTFKLLSKAGDPVLAFSRTDTKETVVVAINVSDAMQSVTVDAGVKNARLGQAFKAPDAAAAPEVTSDKSGQARVQLAPKSLQVLVKAH